MQKTLVPEENLADDGKRRLRRLKLCCEAFGGGRRNRAGLRFAGIWGLLGDQKGWKTRPWMRYTTRIRFVAGFWVFREAEMGAKRWSRVPMEPVYVALWEAKMGAIWAFLGRQVGPLMGL